MLRNIGGEKKKKLKNNRDREVTSARSNKMEIMKRSNPERKSMGRCALYKLASFLRICMYNTISQ